MLDWVFLLVFIATPIAIWWVTKSLTWTVVSLAFGVGITGNFVQSSISIGMHFNLRGLQWLSSGMMLVLLAAALIKGRKQGSIRSQAIVILAPALVIAGFLIAMRLMASNSPGPLSAVGYLINHPVAEDNAKWLNLASQLASGRDITFNGYAGGPLLIVMSMMAAFISVLSMILLGGVNQVAVAANTVVGLQFLFIALIPFAFVPIAGRHLPWLRIRGMVPRPLIWLGMFVLFVAMSVITSYGHLSLEYVLLVLALWSLVFIARVPGLSPLLTSLIVITTASVWLPLNVLGFALLIGCFVLMVKRRNYLGIGLVVVTGLAVWDALISSTLYLFGINLGGASADVAAETGASTAGTIAAPIPVDIASSLFTAPGGVEVIQPIVGGLAAVAVLFVFWAYSKNSENRRDENRWQSFTTFAPVIAFGSYVFVVQVADAITTGQAPHYGGQKLTYALVIMALCSFLPLALATAEQRASGTTIFQWASIGAVVLLLMADSILPRAISALSPTLWPGINSNAPQYWSLAEVRDTPNQTIDSVPVGCLFAPPESAVPTALPLGQQSYACSRLLIGLAGLEGQTGSLGPWLQTDWLSNSEHWKDYYPSLVASTTAISDRNVITMNKDQIFTGLLPVSSLLASYRPAG